MRKEFWKVADFSLYNDGDKMSPVKTNLEARDRLVSHISKKIVPRITESIMDGVRRITRDVVKDK